MAGSKSIAKSAILDSIRRSETIARIDLAKIVDLSPATVTTITAEMIADGLIEEVAPIAEATPSSRGRPRVDLKLRADAFLVAGLKIAESVISVVLVNFEGSVVRQHTHRRNQTSPSLDVLILQVRAALDETLEGTQFSFDELSAIGVGIAGIVDATRGFLHWSPVVSDKNVEMADKLQSKMGRPIFLDNDANLVAMAEQYMGDAKNTSNFIVVTIEAGVGMGIVIDNQLYRGARGCGAEFGHTKVQLDGALCRCGQRGCLEAYVADYALLREASFESLLGRQGPSERSVQDILAEARAGEPIAASIVNRSNRFFAMGLANLVNLFDPELIILSGERMTFDHLYAEDVMDAIKSTIVQVDAAPPEIVIHKWGDDTWARGAAMLALVGISELQVRDGTNHAA